MVLLKIKIGIVLKIFLPSLNNVFFKKVIYVCEFYEVYYHHGKNKYAFFHLKNITVLLD